MAGKKGTFIIQHIGAFSAQGACSDWTILADSGTADLVGITGNGSYAATSETVDMPFNYTIDEALSEM
ncbi:MAG TPA: hypothetical protein DD827_07505 [Gammaproteobacteria bacterium]|nr:hypothetical protein [Gammaproteobacteria bacterium]